MIENRKRREETEKNCGKIFYTAELTGNRYTHIRSTAKKPFSGSPLGLGVRLVSGTLITCLFLFPVCRISGSSFNRSRYGSL